MVSFEIPGKPMAKGRPRFMKNGHTYTPNDTASYENLVKLAYKQTGARKLAGQIQGYICAWFPIPKSTGKKQASLMERQKIHPTKKPDLDNIAKIIFDSLNGIAYDDDSQIVAMTLIKRYCHEPHVDVSLWEYGMIDD